MLIIVVLAVIQIVLPIQLAYTLWRGRVDDRAAWFVRVAGIAAFGLWLFLAGRWDFFGYALRYVIAAALIAGAIAGFWRVRRMPWTGDGRFWRFSRVNDLALLVIGAGFLAFTLPGYSYAGAPVAVAAPLRGGAFYVAQGGGAPLLNYHNRFAPQRYALDIVELNALGMRAEGLQPEQLQRYVIYGEAVHSPCEGEIVERRDGLDNLIPPASDRDNPAGNHVVIACKGVRITLAHLQNGSVTRASRVETGDLIGRVGNSGNTSEPHLHMHAERNGHGVPLLVEGRFLTRNERF